MEDIKSKYTHIAGWGIDANLNDNPNYPIKKYTGDDHKRLNWIRPELQPASVEKLMSVERPSMPAVFGTAIPPSGLSGIIRRKAFTYSENLYRRWLPLMLADRINVFEGNLHDLAHGRIPNVFAERGWKALWRLTPGNLIKKIVIRLLIAGAIAALIIF